MEYSGLESQMGWRLELGAKNKKPINWGLRVRKVDTYKGMLLNGSVGLSGCYATFNYSLIP